MNISSTSDQCSSGCESGWTRYLDQLSNSTDIPHTKKDYVTNYKGVSQYDDEDLSMVSDASSAPPHYSYASSISEDKKKSKQKNSKTKETKDNVAPCDNQQVFNAAHFEVVFWEERGSKKSFIFPSISGAYCSSKRNWAVEFY
ncbi:hypothetical protein BUALT_Bualt08G0044600 [Buddleja alternifolia]|uniref:Uncharacterized protein n=1 Tax=Buddleja alternifolia TaxID=168488 RepID=A0AAV6X525_9LAMI|nr:hypothetical protein BUALT_Bualt08G0044600 [Buddleja alternifolia]